MNKQIELSCGFGELGAILDEFGEDKNWKIDKEMGRQEDVEGQ